MRFFTGLIVGIVLTIGTAYVVDALHAAPGPDDKGAPQRMVNWEVVNSNMRGVSSGVQSLWARLVGGAKELEKELPKTGS